MKIFYFDTETGIYRGEGFADEAPLRRGDHIIPADATPIEPPPYRSGRQAPFFDPRARRWKLRELPSVKEP